MASKREKKKIYGNNINSILTELNMPQQELADIVGTNAAHISRICTGQTLSVSLPIAMEIAAALNRKVEEVFILNKPK